MLLFSVKPKVVITFVRIQIFRDCFGYFGEYMDKEGKNGKEE